MASLVMHPCNVLVLDEPTNHLDIQSKDVLKSALMNYTGTLLVVSHDRDFLAGLTDKVIEFKDQQTQEYLGDIEYYLEKRKLDNMRAVELQKSASKSSNPKPKKEEVKKVEVKTQLSREDEKKIRRQIQYIERDIANLEADMKVIEDKMLDPDFFKAPEFDAENEKYLKMKETLNEKTEEWEELVEKL